MRDYTHIAKDGTRTPIAELSTPLIRAILDSGVKIKYSTNLVNPAECVRRRLILELEIRAMGLR